jgi:hypothetical protein
MFAAFSGKIWDICRILFIKMRGLKGRDSRRFLPSGAIRPDSRGREGLRTMKLIFWS